MKFGLNIFYFIAWFDMIFFSCIVGQAILDVYIQLHNDVWLNLNLEL